MPCSSYASETGQLGRPPAPPKSASSASKSKHSFGFSTHVSTRIAPRDHSPNKKSERRQRPWEVMKRSTAVGARSRRAPSPSSAAAPSVVHPPSPHRLPRANAIMSAHRKVQRSSTAWAAAAARASATHAASMSRPTHVQPYCAAACSRILPSPQPRSHSTSEEVSLAARRATGMRPEAHGTKGETECGPLACQRASTCLADSRR
mmetsp:Transcript_13349/g.28258  ORF Transcript_13349/g.28258 Transcript_13349/m.28258 type:complete len:205 (-) Transcript_13349:50-664(-)